MARAKTESPPIPEYIERINQDHFVANEDGRAVVYREASDDVLKRPKLERMTFEDFSKIHMTELVSVIKSDGTTVDKPLGRAWLESPYRRQYLYGIVFDPTNAQRANQYNLWRGFAVESKQGNWERMRNHIREVFCSKDEALEVYVLDYFAQMVQRPGQAGQVALVAKGPEGAGKGMLFRAFVRIFGSHGLHVVHASHLVG